MVNKSWVAFTLWMLCQILIISNLKQYVKGYLLPGNIIPNSYNIELITDFKENQVQGKETIKIQCVSATNEIILHVKDLEIIKSDVTLKHLNEESGSLPKHIAITSQNYKKENDFYIMTLDQELVPGCLYLLYITFQGKMNKNAVGYYKGTYINTTPNESKSFSATFFIPNEARSAFPCFDEPKLKATFKISLGHHKDFKAISTMPIEETKPFMNKANWVIDHFQSTPTMSTHVLGFVLSEFDVITASLKDSNTLLHIWARNDVINQTEFAREISLKLISYFENVFDTKFPLPELDIVVLPGWKYKTYENWGLITIQEDLFLVNEETNVYRINGIAQIISHELVYQWFGNLVTMHWWTDTWMIEGFTEHMGCVGVQNLFPEWNSLDQKFISDYSYVWPADEWEKSHPIWRPIENPSDLSHVLDQLTYKKASLLFRMINNILGQDVFFAGISNYLNKYKYSVATSEEFWEALTDTAQTHDVIPVNLTMKMIVDTWTLQTGYPILNITRNYVTSEVTITQEHCLAENVKRTSPHLLENCWWIPLSYTNNIEVNSSYDTKPKSWLSCEGSLTINTNVDADQWLLFNLNFTVMCRIHYDKRNWELLQHTLLDNNEYTKIDTMSRFQLITNSMESAWYGALDYETAFNLISYIKHETNHAPLMAGLERLDEIRARLLRKPIYEQFKKFMNSILEPHFKQISNITRLQTVYPEFQIQREIVKWSCYYNVLDCNKQYINLFKMWYNHESPDQNNPIPLMLQYDTYCEASYHMGKEAWDFLQQRHENTENIEDKQIYLIGMGCVQDESLVKIYLQWSINPSNKFVVASDLTQSMFNSVLRTRQNHPLAIAFFKKHFMQFVERYNNARYRIGWFIIQIFTILTSCEEIEEFKDFVSSVSEHLSGVDEEIKCEQANTKYYCSWYQMNYDKVERYFLSK